ncbi:MAG: hypothetical protein BVN35_02865 [Proteobacteria bacterium ST_bin11]|nr:MAG: hypothetical protein BVN35_02865 [Proteobacteria bacterium ST_bin11]
MAVAGGLMVGSVVTAQAELPIPVPTAGGWVTSGSATLSSNGVNMRIDQHTDRAILNWQEFNVGKDNTVQFAQPGSSSIALNRIHDQNPSQIFGQIIANGQIYLYNKNGFVFGKDSVINANTVLASTLQITDEVFNRGITRVYDESNRAALGIDGESLSPETSKILIEAGAKITTDNNGRIVIVAPTIENSGALSTGKQGQIILAASQDKVYMQTANKDDPFAGLIVEVETGGKVTNTASGSLRVPQGNITMAGFAVNQEGRVSATTSVNVNGSIRLQAREKQERLGSRLIYSQTNRVNDLGDGLGVEAEVNLRSGSVTEVLPDEEGGSSPDGQLQPTSHVDITANTVKVAGGATLRVPGGKVDIKASDRYNALQGTKGKIFIDSNALIDVSGIKDVSVAMERNVGEISAQSFDLRNAPLQRNGVLRGETVRVDLRKGSQVVDTSGAVARISRSIDERLGAGGEINLTSSGDVIINDNARLDISGGSVIYQDGFVNTTKLLTDYGRIVDISDADPNETYVSIFGFVTETHKKWGVETIWDLLGENGLMKFERGYVEGKNAGSLKITGARVAWNGNLQAGSQVGIYQRSLANLPNGGRFSIDMAVFQSLQGLLLQNSGSSSALDADDVIPTGQNLVISAELLNNSGIKDVSLKTLGRAELGRGVRIAMQPNSSLAVEASSIAFDANFQSAGGELALNSVSTGLVADSGNLVIGSQAGIDVSGLWVNDAQQDLMAVLSDPVVINGGKVSAKAAGNLTVNEGASIFADGGAWLALSGELAAGEGGDIELAAVGGGLGFPVLRLAGNLSAYGLEKNGSLTLNSGKIIIGQPGSAAEALDALVLGGGTGSYDLANFARFNDVTLVANSEELTVKSSVNTTLRAANRVLNSDYLAQPSGTRLADFTSVQALGDFQRQPLNLALNGFKAVKIETGSSIHADTGATINVLSGAGSIFVDGRLQADAGKIYLSTRSFTDQAYDPKQVIWVGKNGQLLANATTRFNPIDEFGNRTGDVLDGGQITLEAWRGAVVLEEGAELAVSGTSESIDILQSAGGVSFNFATQQIASNAGSIKIVAAEGAVIDAKLSGAAGSPLMHGGKLELVLDRLRRFPPSLPDPENPFPETPLIVNITQTARRSINEDIVYGDDFPEQLNGKITLSADRVSAGGFADLSIMAEQVVFQGDVRLTTAEHMKFDAARFSASSPDNIPADILLQTRFLELGASLNRTLATSASAGHHNLTAEAGWIELKGATTWNGFNRLSLNSEHDIRTVGIRLGGDDRDYLGSLVTAADLSPRAGQIYPSTLTKFVFAVKNNADGRIDISGNNSDQTPLSAAGELIFEAPNIRQAGAVKAPLGTITFNASQELTLDPGSLTSVSAKNVRFDSNAQRWVVGEDMVIPFGITQGGLDWLYPLDDQGRRLVYGAPPEKRVVLSAPVVDIQQGSVVDVAGGGNLQSYEFVPGAGGDNDYLQLGSASYQGGFAILPSLDAAWAPFDHYESQGFAYAPGAKIRLGGSADLAAGDYVILPARYALLPGAYLITPLAGYQDLPGNRATVDGRVITPGKLLQAGTDIESPRSSGYLIETGADVRKQSQYDIQLSSSFYPERARKTESALPLLPSDSGQVSLVAQTRLIMDGQFMVDAVSGGRGAKVDIASSRISVVKQFSNSPAAGTLEILDSDLVALNADSLLLGGARSRNSVNLGETDLQVTATEVIFNSDTQLRGPEIMAVASDLIDVKANATLAADRPANSGDSVFNVQGDGAVMRVSGGEQVTFNRTNSTGVNGRLEVAESATLAASESMLLGASRSTILSGNIDMQGGSLNLAANTINIGEVSGLSSNALNWSNQKLSNLTVDELVLTANDSIGVYGNVGLISPDGTFALGDDGVIKAVPFRSLVLNTAGLVGHGTANNLAKLQADTLLIQNSANQVNQNVVDGQGRLDLIANSVRVADGNFAILGFSGVNIQAINEFRAAGDGTLKVGGNLNLATPLITADGGARLKIDARGYQANFGFLESQNSVTGSLGGAVSVLANAINFNTRTLLPSGSLDLHALLGDVSVGSAAQIDLAGRGLQFADRIEYTDGGRFKATADNGGVTVSAGSLVDIDSGGGNAAGGSLVLRSPTKSVLMNGQIQAKSGSATLDVNTFDPSTNFTELMQTLSSAGIDQNLYFRVREANISQEVGSSIKARNLTLVSDKGAITLAGAINADGKQQGGRIELYAGDGITLASGASLSANGTDVGAKGGRVLLSSVDADSDGVSGIDLQSGSSIRVAGVGAEGGEIVLRALRTDSGVEIQPIAADVSGYTKFQAEGVKKYSNLDDGEFGEINLADGEINLADIAQIKADTAAYMTATNIQNVAALASGLQLLAGVEINYTGDLALQDRWDLVDWRYEAVPDTNVWNDAVGRLAIKTTGSFNVNQSLTDGFKTIVFRFPGPTAGSFRTTTIQDKLQGGESWSFNIVAGADSGSADLNSVGNAGDLSIGADTVVRTGTGDIQLSAGGDMRFASNTSSVYSGGRPTELEPFGTLRDRFVGLNFYVEYPVAGGDLALSAGGDILGVAAAENTFNNWLLRVASFVNDGNGNQIFDPSQPYAWGAALGYITTGANAARSGTSLFQQNLGSFGGGNVSVEAGGNIANLDVMMPTTGKQRGTVDPSVGINVNRYVSNQVEVQGGGTLLVNAGLNVVGGTYLLGKGSGVINAGGQVVGGTSFADGARLLLGDTQFKVSAAGGARLAGVSDPMMLHSGDVNFFSYGANSSLDVKSLSGDVYVNADNSVFAPPPANSAQSRLAQVFPGSLHVVATDGSIKLGDKISLFPSASAQLNLFAAENITGAEGNEFYMSDFDPALLPNRNAPIKKDEGFMSKLSADIAQSNATTPLHRGDLEPVRMVTQTGNIENIVFTLPKNVLIKAGRDIVDLSVIAQHVNADDVSMIEALRDIRYSSKRSPNTGILSSNENKIEIGGLGEVLIKSGRHLDLGASSGITSAGNTFNTSLVDSGANLTVLVGANGEVDYAGFVSAYLRDNPEYSSEFERAKLLIVGFMRDRTQNNLLSETDALNQFANIGNRDLTGIQTRLNSLVIPVLFNEIKASGTASAGTDDLGNQRGFNAINTLFPGSAWQGDLSMIFSKIHTLDNGNINLVVPGGEVNVGLAVSFAGKKDDSDLGIVAWRKGDISAMVRDDFQVNTSRAFVLDGGDILIWSSEGDIDAGRGAKSALSIPPVEPTYDQNGNLTSEPPAIISGSGIRTAANSIGTVPGDVFLFAPRGVVDAGEAGIGGKNVFIAATAVLGANNIQVSGVGTGVPVAATGSVAAGLTGTSNVAAGVSQMAESSVAGNNAKDNGNSIAKAVLGMLSVELLGFGD